MLEVGNFERKKTIPFNWTAQHRELVKDIFLGSYFEIRKAIGGCNEQRWPSDDAIRKQLNKWGYSRRPNSAANATPKYASPPKIIKPNPLPIVESPPKAPIVESETVEKQDSLADYRYGIKQQPQHIWQTRKPELFILPEGHQGKTILTVGIDDCKWIYGEIGRGDVSGITYCGNNVIPGQSYCGLHYKLSHTCAIE
jgi:hypothetical protein